MWLWLILIGTSIWVFFDSKKIGVKKTDEKSFANLSPVGWLLGSLLLWIVVFPLYLIKRSGLKKKFQAEMSPAPFLSVSAQLPDYEQLRKLAKLKEDGIISPEEFDKKKKELLML